MRNLLVTFGGYWITKVFCKLIKEKTQGFILTFLYKLQLHS